LRHFYRPEYHRDVGLFTNQPTNQIILGSTCQPLKKTPYTKSINTYQYVCWHENWFQEYSVIESELKERNGERRSLASGTHMIVTLVGFTRLLEQISLVSDNHTLPQLIYSTHTLLHEHTLTHNKELYCNWQCMSKHVWMVKYEWCLV